MGMDLVARKPSQEQYQQLHFNWSSWGVFGNLLEMLSVDTSSMAGSNDGKYIKKVDCLKYAKAIKRAIDENRIVSTKIADSTYYGGFKFSFAIDSKGQSLTEDDKEYLMEIVDFFNNCNGCRQF